MYNVLIADDHAVVRYGLSSLIGEQPNFKVVDQAANGTDTYLRVERGDIDILVMDLSMPPGESGLEIKLITSIRKPLTPLSSQNFMRL